MQHLQFTILLDSKTVIVHVCFENLQFLHHALNTICKLGHTRIPTTYVDTHYTKGCCLTGAQQPGAPKKVLWAPNFCSSSKNITCWAPNFLAFALLGSLKYC